MRSPVRSRQGKGAGAEVASEAVPSGTGNYLRSWVRAAAANDAERERAALQQAKGGKGAVVGAGASGHVRPVESAADGSSMLREKEDELALNAAAAAALMLQHQRAQAAMLHGLVSALRET